MIPTISSCVCCSLNKGSIIIGMFLIAANCMRLLTQLKKLPYLGPDKNEDAENKKQRRMIQQGVFLHIILDVVMICVGIAIIVAVFKRFAKLLMVSAIFVFLIGILRSAIGMIYILFHWSLPFFLIESLSLLIVLYLCLVLWSTYKLMEEEDISDEEEEYYDDPDDYYN